MCVELVFIKIGEREVDDFFHVLLVDFCNNKNVEILFIKASTSNILAVSQRIWLEFIY